MHDLRKKALMESGKTVSRKAKARGSAEPSPAVSPRGSRAGSRATSRYASEEEDLTDSDNEASMISSLANSEDGEDATATWADLLKDRIVELLDRKRSSTKGREETATRYYNMLRKHYAAEEIQGDFDEIVSALMKMTRSESREEVVAALKALCVTILNSESEDVYDVVYNTIKATCVDSTEEAIKVQAIYVMAAASIFGGGAEIAAEDMMEFLMEIIESDGNSVEAPDNVPVVSAALSVWGFLASHLDDLQHVSEQAMEAFIEQLDSTDVDVQTAAAVNIAQIFEDARQGEEERIAAFEDAVEAGDLNVRNEEDPYNAYDLQYDQHRLLQRMTELTKGSAKQSSRSDRRNLRNILASVMTSLELGKGPSYSTAGRSYNPNMGGTSDDNMKQDFEEYGYRHKINLGGLTMTIDSWALSARFEFLKAVLGGGLTTHFHENPAIKEDFSSAHTTVVSPKVWKDGKKGNYESDKKRHLKVPRSMQTWD